MAICRRMRRLGPQQWSFSAYFPLRPRFVDEILKKTHDHRKNLRKPFDFRLPKKVCPTGGPTWRSWRREESPAWELRHKLLSETLGVFWNFWVIGLGHLG
ncbi:hypothetical protein PVK06_036789 [Gossypium arboreum]|uniref:Uncharacterized protein n=1 Tax=Gossypium arboreum TaxID=29729 RepID=A0ABR0NKG4_GOSAR|nr:hypothetical protein PVK06_036789 [Gossypium arboreum]